jgi:hypothetical protein
MEYPLVIIHRGYSSYLKWCLLQARLAGKHVVLIGNESNEKLKKYIDFKSVKQFHSGLFEDFEKVYEHMSTNEYKFELICFERWFVLLDFMEKESLDVVVHLDSDVMLFNDLHEIVQSFARNTLAAYHIPKQTYDENRWIGVSHTSVWTREGLRLFCEFMVETYSNNKEELHNKWNWHHAEARRGGISDMALLYLFYTKHENEIINLAMSRRNNQGQIYCLDLNINSGENYDQHEFEMAPSPYFFKIKKIRYQNEQIIGLNFYQKKSVVFESLHCQGKAKILMFHYYRGKKSMADRMEFMTFAFNFFRQRSSTYGRFLIKKLLGKHYSS